MYGLAKKSESAWLSFTPVFSPGLDAAVRFADLLSVLPRKELFKIMLSARRELVGQVYYYVQKEMRPADSFEQAGRQLQGRFGYSRGDKAKT